MAEHVYTSYSINEEIGINYLDDVVTEMLDGYGLFINEGDHGTYVDDNALNGEVEQIEALLEMIKVPYSHFTSAMGDGSDESTQIIDSDGNEVYSGSADEVQFTVKDLMAISYAAKGDTGVRFTDELKEHARYLLKDQLDQTFARPSHALMIAASGFLSDLNDKLNNKSKVEAQIENEYLAVEQAVINAVLNREEAEQVFNSKEVDEIIFALYRHPQTDPEATVATPDGEFTLEHALQKYSDMDFDDSSSPSM